MTRTKRMLVAGVLAASVVGASVGIAAAGELTGSGKQTGAVGRAASECSFSGLDEAGTFDEVFFGRTQTYGQLVRQGLKSEFPSPGVACNPTKAVAP